MRARRPQIQSRGLPGESLARDRPTKSARRRLKGATSDGGPAPKAEREAPSGAACRERLAPEREKAARPRGGRRPFFFAKTREAPANEKGGPPRVPPRRPVRASPPSARATRPGGRRRPSLPQGRPCSTFGAGRLNFRVRHGSGCAPAARAAGPRGALRRGQRRGGSALRAPWGPHSARGRCPLRTVGGGGDALCVPKGSAD